MSDRQRIMSNKPGKGERVVTNYLTQVDDLLRSDGIKYHWPEGTEELYSTVANLQSIAATLGYLIHQSAEGIARLPGRSGGLRTDTMTGRLDPDATRAAAVSELEDAQRVLEVAAAHLGSAHGSLGRLYVDVDNAPTAPPSLTVVRDDM